jgi:GT2 family glycosyltransferase
MDRLSLDGGVVSCIAIPTLDALRTLKPLVTRLLRDPEVEALLILDNGHRRPSAKNWFRAVDRDPRVHVVDARGWSLHRMWNWGREWATANGHGFYGAYNDDLVVPADLTSELAAALRRDPALWLVAPEWTRSLSSGVDLTGEVRRVQGTQRHGGISGWCWLMRADAPVPPIDEQFEWWYGDCDLAEQIRLAGGELGIVEGLPVDHKAETTARHHPWTRKAIVRDGARFEAKYGQGSAIPTRVSVLLPTKDRPERLGRALSCILAQDYPDLEVVIQNGGARVELPDDPRIVYLEGADTGIANALNIAAAASTGDVLHVTCDDDEMRPGTLWSAASALRSAEWTYGWMRTFLETRTGYRRLHKRHTACLWAWNLDEHKAANSINQPTAFFTRSSYEKLGPFDERFPMVWDYEWWMRLGTRFEPVQRDHCDADYVIWPGSTSVHAAAAMALEVERLQELWAEKGYGER